MRCDCATTHPIRDTHFIEGHEIVVVVGPDKDCHHKRGDTIIVTKESTDAPHARHR